MAASTRDYSYNFPLFVSPLRLPSATMPPCTLADVQLFGLVAFELPSTNCLQFFLSIVLFSGVFDLIFIIFGMRGPSIILGAILALLKAPIYFSGLASLRERGGDLAWASRGFGAFGQGWSSLPTTVQPGHTGPQNLGPHAQPAPPGSFPSGGYRLGGEDGPSQPQQKGRDGYEAIA